MFRAIRNIGRLLSIGRTLARHDALFPLENVGLSCRAIGCVRRTVGFGAKPPQDIMGMRPGERLTTALQALGPSFIKLGQALSVRSDLVGEELADDLSALQDRLPPFPGEQAVATIEEEFGQPLAEIFSSFGEIPVAAASIAQVHFATTVEGDDVAVKVLRPGIEQAFAIDLDLLRWIAEKAERLAPASRRLRPTDVIETLAETVAEEMDLRLEAAAGEELRANFEGDDAFRVPAMDWTRTGRRVLTLERIDGIPVDEVAALEEAGHDAEALVANMARSFFLQVFRDGFFHADLHPGNILVADDGAIQALDFGIMGRIDKRTRLYLAEMLIGFLTADYAKVAAVHFRAGYVPASQSEQAFAQAARAIAEPIMGRPLKDISLARLLAQLFMVTERFQMPAQPHLLLLQKTMLVAEGVGRRIYPDTNMWELARPLIESWMEEAMTPEARAAETMAEAGRLLERLPDLLLDMSGSVSALTREGLKLHPDTLAAFSGGGQSHPRWPYWAGAALVAAGVIAVL
jgi:ubiquinone biosynthesis protein